MSARRKIGIPKKSKRKLKWGIAGCGNFAENTFLPTFQHLKRSRLISVYSSDKKRAEFIAGKFGANNSFSSFDDFLKSDIEAVYIAGANADHYWQALEAAKAGKHILSEKPLALNSEQAEEMVKVCDENNVRLSVDYVHRFHPLNAKAKELIEKGMIGKIVSVSANFNIYYPPSDNFRFSKENGGGALRDLGTHMIDLLRFFGGEIDDIKGYVDNIIFKSEVDDFAAGLVKFNQGGYGAFNVSFNTRKGFNRIEVLGYKGSISIQDLVGKRNVMSKLIINLDGEAKKTFRRRANKLLYLLRSVQNSFLNNETPEVTGNDGVVNLRLMEELESGCQLKES